MTDTPSSQYSIDGLADLVAYLPDSHGERKGYQESEEDPFDIDILIRKLEAYKTSVEEAQDQIRRKRSINPMEALQITTAARLKLRLDGRPAASSESYDNSVLTPPGAVAFPSSVSSIGSSTSNTSHFDPITPEEHDDVPQVMFSGRENNRETWKSSHSVVSPSKEAETYDISIRYSGAHRRPGRLEQELKTSKSVQSIKPLHGRSKVVSPLASPTFVASDEWLDVARAIHNLTTAESIEVSAMTINEMSMCPPNEDRVRREIETYRIKDWVESNDVKPLEVTAFSREVGQVQSEPLNGSDHEVLEQDGTTEKSNQSLEGYRYGKATLRERVGSLWHRRTKTDKIISLYFDVEKSPKLKAPRTS